MPVASTPGLEIHYELGGEGPPVLFIGGTGGDLRHKPNVLDGPLPRSLHVIAYDQRGLGRSGKPEGPYSMAQYADDAAALLDVLGHERVGVVGVSFGGMVALNMALRHPTRIDRLVLCCTSPGGRLPSFPFHELADDLDPGERALRLMAANDVRHGEAWQAEHPDAVRTIVQQARDMAALGEGDADAARGARLQIEARAGHDVLDRLGEIAHPTLVCAGRYDGIAPTASQHALEAGIPNAELRWYEGGHVFFMTDRQAWIDVAAFVGGDGQEQGHK